jgi:hypothetical protein
MSDNFQSLSILSQDTFGGQEIKVVPEGGTIYVGPFHISNQDSLWGIFSTFAGTRYGVNDVTITAQDATSADTPTAAWTDVSSGVTFGTGGTSGSPVSVHQIIPHRGINRSIKPYVRFKIVAGASTSATFTKILRTMRGLK